jgi:hypothetical protein
VADVQASGGAGSRPPGTPGYRFLWDLVFDDVANTVTITATHTTFAGQAATDPQQASITVILNSSVNVTVDCLTGTLSTGGNFSQASPGPMLNAGAKTRTGVRLRVSANRAAALEFTTQYTPPA